MSVTLEERKLRASNRIKNGMYLNSGQILALIDEALEMVEDMKVLEVAKGAEPLGLSEVFEGLVVAMLYLAYDKGVTVGIQEGKEQIINELRQV